MSEPSLNTASGPQSRLPPRDVACADEAPRLQVIRLKGITLSEMWFRRGA